MTFTTLQQQTNSSDSDIGFHDLTPVGTDEDEYKRYQALMHGNLGDQGSDDFTDDLTDAGLIPDGSGYRYGS